MKKYYRNSLKFVILERIKQMPGNVVVRSEIKDMGKYREISRSLQALVEMGELIKIGCGAYAKARYSEYLNKPVIAAGFDLACREALTKLGVRWEPGTAEKAYNSGESTQVPVRTVVQLKSRFRGKLTYSNNKPIFENNTNAR
jgi:hypothetical protein